MGWGKKKEEVNGTGLGEWMGDEGQGGRQRDGAATERGQERRDRLSLENILSLMEAVPLHVFGGLRIEVPPIAR